MTSNLQTNERVMLVSESQLAKALETWELRFRENPEAFLSPEEIEAKGIEAVAKEKAAYIFQLVQEGS